MSYFKYINIDSCEWRSPTDIETSFIKRQWFPELKLGKITKYRSSIINEIELGKFKVAPAVATKFNVVKGGDGYVHVQLSNGEYLMSCKGNFPCEKVLVDFPRHFIRYIRKRKYSSCPVLLIRLERNIPIMAVPDKTRM